MGSQSERTLHGAGERMWSHRQKHQAKGLRGLPKRDRIRGRRTPARPVFTLRKPGGKCDPTATSNEQQERGNHPVLSGAVGSGVGANRMHGSEGMVSEAKARGNARDRLTETTTVGW
jgi:hypothetical protein